MALMVTKKKRIAVPPSLPMEPRLSLDATATMIIEMTSGTMVIRTALIQMVPMGSRKPTTGSSADVPDWASAAPARRPATRAPSAYQVIRRVSVAMGGRWRQKEEGGRRKKEGA